MAEMPRISCRMPYCFKQRTSYPKYENKLTFLVMFDLLGNIQVILFTSDRPILYMEEWDRPFFITTILLSLR